MSVPTLSRLILVFVLHAVLSSGALAQSTVTTVTGQVYRGSILSDSPEAIEVMTVDSIAVRIPRERIESISYGRSGVITEVSGTTSPLGIQPRGRFFAVGATFGTPGGLNLTVGHYWEEWGARLSGMVLGDIGGFQLNGLKLIERSGRFEAHAGLAVGAATIGRDEWLYIMPTIDANWRGMFLELGLSIGAGDYSNPQLMFQLGYFYRFDD